MKQVCTSIEQSKKLLELGLDLDTADMFWRHENPSNYDFPVAIDKYERPFKNNTVSWSLTALEDLLPNFIRDEQMFFLSKWKRTDDSWKIAYHLGENEYVSFSGNNFDIVYDMIVWLIENNFFHVNQE